MARQGFRYPLERVQGFTDGVFAIAATLLVLDLTARAFSEVTTDEGMWLAIAAQWQSVVALLVSFLLLSMLWMIHLRQFADLASADAVLVWLNNVRLLFVVLIPFTTSLNSSEGEFVAGRLLLPLNFFLVALAGSASYWWAASRGGHLLRPDARSDAPIQNLGGIAAVVAGAVSVALSPFVGSFAFLAYALNPPLEAILTARARRRQRGDAGGPGRARG